MLKNVSASQVDGFKKCPRAWYARKVLKAPEPPNPYFERGTKIHDALEGAYDRANPRAPSDELIPYVMAAAPFLPKPGTPGYFVEREIDFSPGLNLPRWIGFIDFLHMTSPRSRIIDYKTRSKLSNAPKEEDLRVDIQLNSYAFWYFKTVNVDREVEVAHLNLCTNPPHNALYRNVTITKAQVEDLWPSVQDLVVSMVKAESLAPEPSLEVMNSLPPGLSECKKYPGGCPFRGICDHPEDRVLLIAAENLVKSSKDDSSRTLKETNKMGVADRMKKLNGAPPIEVPVQNPRDTDTPPVTPTSMKGNPWGKTQEAVPSDEDIDARLSQVMTGITPPDMPKASPPKKQETEVRGPTAEEIEAATARTFAESDTPADPPKRRGRPPGSKSKTVEAVEATQQTIEKIETSAPAPERTPRKSTAKTGLALYLNCIPTKGTGDYVLGEDVCQPYLDQIAAAEGRTDAQLIKFEWQNMLMARLREAAKNGELPPVIVVRGFSKANEALQCLIPYADTVVTGF